MCDNTPSGRPLTISTSLNQYYSWPVIHLVVSAGVFHISLRPQKIQPRGWKEEQMNNMDLGQFQVQEREFCIPRASVDYRWRVFCVKLPQKLLAMLTSSRIG